MPERGKCGSCGADIIWVKTVAGNWQPLDAEPNPKGNIVLIDGFAHVLKGELFEPMIDPGKERYLSHFATCPPTTRIREGKEGKPKA